MKNRYDIVSDPQKSDLAIIGACAAFDADEERSLKLIKEVERFEIPIIIYGCLTTVNPEKVELKNKFPSWCAKELGETIIKDIIYPWDLVKLPSEFRTKEDYRVYNKKKKFVGLTKGCCFECAYCPHKLGAGNLISRNEEEILEQIKQLNTQQIDTIVLTGIDTASYGRDTNKLFAVLLKKILKELRNDISVCIAQFNPEGLEDNLELLIECCQDERIIDIQLPIQTSSKRLLRIMKRNYSTKIIEKFINDVRLKNKRVIFRTDLMVGFPSETQIELEESINFAKKYFNEVAVYGFELKCNTEIALSNLKFYSKQEIEKRRKYVVEKMKSCEILVHSGGQLISTLKEADEIKQELRSEVNFEKQRIKKSKF